MRATKIQAAVLALALRSAISAQYYGKARHRCC